MSIRYIILSIIAAVFCVANSVCIGAVQAGLQGIYPLEFPEPIGGINGLQVPGQALPPDVLPTPGHMGTYVSLGQADVPLSNHGDEFTWIQINTPNGPASIYFPVTGRQPTTPETAVWSCANVDNTSVSPITEWYMQMFGWRGSGDRVAMKMGFSPIQGGLSGVQLPDSIIKLHRISMYIPQDIHIYGQLHNRASAFWEVFRAIASLPIGGVLLYRLLIEIRRQDTNTQIGTMENLIGGNNYVERNNARSLIIRGVDEDDWCYQIAGNGASGEILCFFGENQPLPVAYRRNGRFKTEIERGRQKEQLIQDSLFHELLHWYQQLRHFSRTVQEMSAPISRAMRSSLTRLYGYDTKAVPFLSYGMEKAPIDLCELRVICGSIAGSEFYFEGDDLSENAFRCNMEMNLRIGHGAAIDEYDLIASTAVVTAYVQYPVCRI